MSFSFEVAEIELLSENEDLLREALDLLTLTEVIVDPTEVQERSDDPRRRTVSF